VTTGPDDRPLRIVRGDATPEEVAALVAALAAVAARAEASRPRKVTTFRSLWAKPSRNIRPPLGPSAGAWRASGFPR
jgi:hypothetical protein